MGTLIIKDLPISLQGKRIMNDFDQIIERKGTYSVKYNEKFIHSFANNEKASPFWVADMDFSTPKVVLDAISAEIDRSIFGYPYFDDLRESFISFAQKRHGILFERSLVAIAPGMLASIALLIERYSKEGDTIILPFPAYKPFVEIIQNLNRVVLSWPLIYHKNESLFSLDFPLLKSLASEYNSPILLFCSPHNPTGIVFSRHELEHIATIAKESNILVISDEIHADLVYSQEKHIPFSEVATQVDCSCVTCMAPSKTFNIAGEHFSIAIFTNKQMHLDFIKRLRALQSSPDLLATIASRAAYIGGYDWLIALIGYLEENLKMIEDTLKEYSSCIKIVKPKASFITLLDCKAIYPFVEKDSVTNPSLYISQGTGGLLSRFFGQKAEIAMNDGSWFGPEYKEFVRFNYAAPKEVIKKAITKVCEAEKLLLQEYQL